MFVFTSRNFFGYMINQREIESNPEMNETLIVIKSSQKPKEVQSLIGHVAILSCLVSKETNKCLSFFKVLNGGNKF